MLTSSNKIKEIVFNGGTGIFPKFLFIWFAVGGGILIWILKSMETNQLIAVMFPVLFIISYCVLAYRSKLFFITEDKIGDNAYYLGFLYTLSSLSYALYIFSTQQNDPKYIISSFGVALWSTIIGIACRVCLSQLRQDPNDIEKEARIRIAKTANILTSELHHASISFNTYRRSLQQSMEEAFININEKVDATLDNSSKKINEIADKFVTHMSQEFEILDTSSKKINVAAENMASSLNEISNHVSNARTKFGSFGSKLESISKLQEGVLNELITAFNDLTLNAQSLGTHLMSIKKLSDNLTAGEQSISNISGKLDPVLTRFTDLLTSMADKQEVAIKAISNHADELRAQLDRSRKYTEQTHQSLSEMTKILADKLQ